MTVERVLVHAASTEQLTGSLMSLIGTGKASKIASVEADLLADPVITARRGPISGDRLDRLLAVLADARDVRWQGEPVTTSADPVMPRAVVEDGPHGGARVRIEADPDVRGAVALGIARCMTLDREPDVLRPIGAIDLSGPRLERLPTTFDVGRTSIPELLAKTLPALAQRIQIEIRARNLPQLGPKEQPRMAFEVEQEGDRLLVLPTLVYGDPPRARIDGNRLRHLSGALPIRDEDAERRLVHRLRDELNLAPGRRVELHGKDAYAMHTGLASWLRMDARSANASKAVQLDVHVEVDGPRVDIEVTGPGGRSASVAATLRAWQAGVDLVPLEGGGWGRVPMAWLDLHGDRVADLLATRGGDKRVPLYALPDLAKLTEDLDLPPPAELDRLRPLLDDFRGIPHVDANVVGELRPYQQLGVDWLAFCREAGLGCVLADDMGLGKTIQALAAVQGGGKKTLVVAPTSVLFNWVAETAKFRPDLRVATYHGTRRTIDHAADIVLTSYPILRNDIELLQDIAWDIVILDESQTIKNPDSQVARAAYKLAARWRVTLSGTPIENRLDELWSQLHFTNPGLLGGRSDFQDRWAEPIMNGDDGAAKRLRERIRPFVLRRLKREVAKELPSRTDAVMYVELDEQERITYDAIRAATQREIVAMLEAGGGVMAALEALLRLRQASCHTASCPRRSAAAARSRPARASSSACSRRSPTPPRMVTARSCSRSGRRCSI